MNYNKVDLRFFLLGISVPIIWGLGFTFSKAAIAEFPPILLIAFRFSVTALALVWFVKLPKGMMGKIFLISTVSAAMQYGLTFYGLKYLDASTAILVIQLEVPFCTLLAVIFLKERIGLQKVIGMIVAFTGVLLIIGEPRLSGNYMGIYLTVSGAFMWAIGQIMVRKLGDVGGFTLIAWVAVFATPQLFLLSWIVEDNQLRAILDASWIVWTTIIYLGLFMTALGYGIWYYLLGKYPVSKCSPFLMLLPLVTVLFSVLLLGEEPTKWMVFGGLVIMTGIALLLVERKQSNRSTISDEL